MENFNEEEKKPRKTGRKVFKYLILLVVLLTTYLIYEVCYFRCMMER